MASSHDNDPSCYAVYYVDNDRSGKEGWVFNGSRYERSLRDNHAEKKDYRRGDLASYFGET